MKPLCVISCPIDTFSGYGARSRDFVKVLIKVKGEEWDIKICHKDGEKLLGIFYLKMIL